MDLAYLESHRREHELTRMSRCCARPGRLVALRQTGQCEFEIPELLYDMDLPGRLHAPDQTVASRPVIAGPYTGVHCKLTLLSSSVALGIRPAGYAAIRRDDPRFVDDFRAIGRSSRSSAQNDPACSKPICVTNGTCRSKAPVRSPPGAWNCRDSPIDYDTIDDVILHVRYTARDGGGRLRELASLDLEERLGQLAPVRLFSIRHDFPTEWAKFKSKAGTNDLVFKLGPERYPLWTRGSGPRTARGASAVGVATNVVLFAAVAKDEGDMPARVAVTTTDATGQPCKAGLSPHVVEGNLLIGTLELTNPALPTNRVKSDAHGEWALRLPTTIDDLWIAVGWGASQD